MKKVSRKEYVHELPQLQTTEQPTRPRERATNHQKTQEIYGEVCAFYRSY